MARIMISPSKFILGNGEMKNLGKYISDYGKKALIVAHPEDFSRQKDSLDPALKDTDFVNPGFEGECSINEIEKLVDYAKEEKADVVLGLGGGKAIDTAKAVAHKAGAPVIVVPTIASSDAPTSALSVIYTDEGEFEDYMFFPSNPELVLVDSKVIAQAPVEFLIAGMGDALATWFECRACMRSDADTMAGGKSTRAAITLARASYDMLLEEGEKAIAACKANVVTKSLENVIEANTLLSGIGFESSGLAGAHAIHDGFTMHPDMNSAQHGEKVAFGTIVQLVLENAPKEELDEVLGFCKKIGLPTNLKGLGVNEIDEEIFKKVAIAACDPDNNMGNMPFEVTPEDLYAAIMAADQLGSHL